MSLKEREEEGLSESFSVHLHSVTLTHEVSKHTYTHAYIQIYTSTDIYKYMKTHNININTHICLYTHINTKTQENIH